jgi:hypothetical protein
MAAKKYKVGLEIDAWCTKCKVDRLHVIETLKSDGNINRVLCRTCEGIHLFRRPKGEGGTGAKTTSRRRKKPEHVVTEAEQSGAKAYLMTGEYAVGDVIEHSKFSYGKVTALRPGGKMDVMFDEVAKVLLCKDQGSLLLKRGRAAAQARAAAALASAKQEEARKNAEAKDGDEGSSDEE